MESAVVKSDQVQRWDYEVYGTLAQEAEQLLQSSPWPVVRLRQAATHIWCGSTPRSGSSIERTDGIPFIKTFNVQEGWLDLSTIYQVSSDAVANKSDRLAKPGDVFFNIIGATLEVVGRATVIPEGLRESYLNQNVVAIRLKKDINPEYISTCLQTQLLKKQIAAHSKQGNQVNFSTEEVRDLRLPLPPRPVQDQIAAIMQEAYATRQAMLAEAEALREGVDEYVLSELGIKWDVIPDVRRFVVSSEELLGGRFDAGHQSPQAEQALKLLKESGHTVVQLGDIIETIHYGASIKNEYFDEGIPFIRIGNLKPNELDTSDIVFLSETVRKQIGKAFVETGDLLMSRSGSVGIVACVPPDADGFAFGSYQIKFRLKAGAADPKYIAYVLNSPLGMVQTQQQKTGAVQMNITIPGIKAIRVPIPDAGVQEHIVEAADNMRLKAAELQHEAEAVVTRAKVKVERMILEEDSDGVE
jgi:restriction endonuclease S subunit